MKILLINVTYGIGSTGKIVQSLYENYKKIGHDVRVVFGRHSNTKNKEIIKGGYEFESKLCHALSRVSGNLYGGMLFSTSKIKKIIKQYKPDIVHLHCLNGFFVNIYSLLTYLKKNKIKTVLTNHSDFMFTANCGYSLDCDNWIDKNCKKCARVKDFNGKLSLNRTNHFFKKMQSSVRDFEDLSITNVSPWLTDRCIKSPIYKGLKNESILNPVSSLMGIKKSINPYEKYNVSKDDKIVLYVTSNFLEKEKGGMLLEPIVKHINNPHIKFFVVSGVKCDDFIKLENVIFVQEKLSIEQLASFYQFANCSILLSERETFSMVVAESLTCGTPLVGFKAGGPETIGINPYSVFVEQKDINGFCVELIKKLESSFSKDEISKLAKEKYSEEKITSDYLKFYEGK